MPREPAARRFTRSLRFRLTASYALFFSFLLLTVGLLFRERLRNNLDVQSHDVVDQEWAAMKGYLKIERNQPSWFYDPKDPDEDLIVNRIRHVYLLADAEGRVIEPSTTYESIGFDAPEDIRAVIRAQKPVYKVRYDSSHNPYLIKQGVVYDEGHNAPFFVAIGMSLTQNQRVLRDFTRQYIWYAPLMILSACLLGWWLAGRALTPVLAVARTAQRISGSNLSLRIPTRGAGDELDYLISTFNRMIQRLESSFQQIRQFSTDVSHELRTPITAVRGQLEVALFTAETQDQYREAILNALQDIERLSQIVRALLLLSQAESGQVVLQKTPTDLPELVRDVVDQFQIPAEAAQVDLRATMPEHSICEVDRVQIERMLSNLLSNAIKFTSAGGEVEVILGRRDGQIELAVRDTGRGIPAEHLPNIFDRFYRVPQQGAEASPEKGLGLGLSFVAWIARAHGGKVEVESTIGQGTRFTVTLPAAVAQPAENSAQEFSVPSPMNEL